MRSMLTPLALGALLGLSACESDEAAFEAGADLDAPPAVEEAPLTDAVPPTTLDNPDVIANDTLQDLNVQPAAPVDTAP